MQYQTTCLRHAELAYQDKATIRQYLDGCFARKIGWLDDPASGTFGYVAELPAEITVVAFRGSQFEINDWQTNLNRKPVAGLHNGFFDALVRVLPMLRRAMRLRNPRHKLLVTGHSLGGALATLAANEISGVDFVDEVHTFGCPRVGTDRFKRIYDATLGDVTYRHVNCCDIVPRLPSAWRYGYEHIGQEVYYDVWGERSVNPTGMYKLCDRGLGRLHHGWKVPTRGISDHALHAYRKVVK